LEKKLPGGIENEDVNCPVHEAEPMDFVARAAVDDFVSLVYDVEDFFRHDE
jgi:hypothetical protein